MQFGFCGERDLVPLVLRDLGQFEINSIFLAQFNENVEKDFQIPACFARANSIRSIFRNFALQKLAVNPLKFARATKFCAASNSVIFAFLNGENLPNLSQIPELKIANFINIFLRNSLIFDANELFLNYIFSRLVTLHGAQKVLMDDKMVYLIVDNHNKIGILPTFKSFDINDRRTYENELKHAYDFGWNLNAVYVAFPRQKNLRKHINIKNCAQNSQKLVKIVPYSISNHFIRRKKCQ